MKTDTEGVIDRGKEIQALKRQAEEVYVRLAFLEKRIREMESGSTHSAFKASVDADTCVACGVCLDLCPTGAISIGRMAVVDPAICTGCGLCVKACPQGAIGLYPVNRFCAQKAGAAG